MPARLYMGVDSRNDHSFRIPRPDVSVAMKEVPNACNLCHTDKEAKWAADAIKKWYGKIPVGKQNFVHDLNALRTNSIKAPKALYNILMSDAADVAKATATSYLGAYPSKQTYMTTLQMLKRSDAQVRRSALESLASFPPKMRIKQTFEMLGDSSKIVRMEAARQLASFPTGNMNEAEKKVLLKAFNEYEKILRFTAERPESQLNLGLFYSNRKMPKKAAKAYEEALYLQPQFVPAYINYSNFLMSQGKNEEAFNLLQKGIKILPTIGIFHHALGLWYVRNKKSTESISEFKKATELDVHNARFAYVYAVALAQKSPEDAIAILEKAYSEHSANVQIVSGLVYYCKQVGDIEKSKKYEKKLKRLQNFSIR
jgi:tetratricopeptide (TPR) repeat protein